MIVLLGMLKPIAQELVPLGLFKKFQLRNGHCDTDPILDNFHFLIFLVCQFPRILIKKFIRLYSLLLNLLLVDIFLYTTACVLNFLEKPLHPRTIVSAPDTDQIKDLKQLLVFQGKTLMLCLYTLED